MDACLWLFKSTYLISFCRYHYSDKIYYILVEVFETLGRFVKILSEDTRNGTNEYSFLIGDDDFSCGIRNNNYLHLNPNIILLFLLKQCHFNYF